VTFGGGTKLVGLYVTRSTLLAENSTSWSVGVYGEQERPRECLLLTLLGLTEVMLRLKLE
jgi:hypothetical protein